MAVCTDERDVYVRCVNDVAVSQTCVGVCVCGCQYNKHI